MKLPDFFWSWMKNKGNTQYDNILACHKMVNNNIVEVKAEKQMLIGYIQAFMIEHRIAIPCGKSDRTFREYYIRCVQCMTYNYKGDKG